MDKHKHQFIGRNSRLDSIQAAILSVKLNYPDEWNKQRIEVALHYSEKLKNIIVPTIPKGFKHVFHLYVVQSENRDHLKKGLKNGGIGCAIHYPKPVPFLDAYRYKNHVVGEFSVSEKLCSEILSLPMYGGIKDEEVEIVCGRIVNF